MHAVPSNNKGSNVFEPEQCERFETNRTQPWAGNECPADWFSEKRLTCDRWVFDGYERTIVNDVYVYIYTYIYTTNKFNLNKLSVCNNVSRK